MTVEPPQLWFSGPVNSAFMEEAIPCDQEALQISQAFLVITTGHFTKRSWSIDATELVGKNAKPNTSCWSLLCLVLRQEYGMRVCLSRDHAYSERAPNTKSNLTSNH